MQENERMVGSSDPRQETLRAIRRRMTPRRCLELKSRKPSWPAVIAPHQTGRTYGRNASTGNQLKILARKGPSTYGQRSFVFLAGFERKKDGLLRKGSRFSVIGLGEKCPTPALPIRKGGGRKGRKLLKVFCFFFSKKKTCFPLPYNNINCCSAMPCWARNWVQSSSAVWLRPHCLAARAKRRESSSA